MKRLLTLLVLALVLSVTAACRDAAEERVAPATTLTVFAAASLKEVLTELEAAYERAHPEVAVQVKLGGSGALAKEMEAGAAADVFLSAADTPMDRLQRAGLIDPRSRRVLAGNELVLVVPAQGGAVLRGFEELAADRVKRVALGDPASVAAGQYADESLRTLRIAAAVRPKAVHGADVRAVLAAVASGRADAGVVYRTDAMTTDRVRVVAAAPAGSHVPVTCSVAVTARTAMPDAARAFAGFLLGPEGKAALRRHGFRVEG